MAAAPLRVQRLNYESALLRQGCVQEIRHCQCANDGACRETLGYTVRVAQGCSAERLDGGGPGYFHTACKLALGCYVCIAHPFHGTGGMADFDGHKVGATLR